MWTWFGILLCIAISLVITAIMTLFLLATVARLVLGIERTDFEDLEKCTMIGLSNKVNILLLSLYRSPSTTGSDMTHLKSAIEAKERTLIFNPFKFTLAVAWVNKNKHPFEFEIQRMDFQLKIKVAALFLSTKYLLWLNKD